MTKKRICGDKDCSHDLDSHHKEYVSSGDVNQVRELQYFACLAPFCSCKKAKVPNA